MSTYPGERISKLSDEDLLKEIHQALTAKALGNAYSDDGEFAASLATLPIGLRAMAATHWLDVSLTLDSITWHFGNFGEPHLVAQTIAGLRELGLQELANCFIEARDLMTPLLANRKDEDCDPYEMLEHAGLATRGKEIDARGHALGNLPNGESSIYHAWVRYTRQHPERVFEKPQ